MLHIEGLDASYLDAQGQTVHAVRDVCFSVPEGKLFTLLGPSGCGKTTTLRAIAGLERPDGGTIIADGVTVYSAASGVFVAPSRRHFGMVFQSYAIWPHMTVFGNAAFPLEVADKRLPKREIEAKVMRALQAVGLDHMAHRAATRMSGGQQQRLALSRALVMEPKLLLLDEPLSNLDAKLREKMRFELKRLQRELGITTVYVTHDQEEALALSHEIAVMREGRIVQCASPRMLYERPASQFVADFVGSTNFVDGTVRARVPGADATVVDSAIGPISISNAGDCKVADKVVVSVRPENLIVTTHRPEPEANLFEGVIDGTVFLGQMQDCQIRVGATMLRARLHPSNEAAIGSHVWISIDPQRCLALQGRLQ